MSEQTECLSTKEQIGKSPQPSVVDEIREFKKLNDRLATDMLTGLDLERYRELYPKIATIDKTQVLLDEIDRHLALNNTAESVIDQYAKDPKKCDYCENLFAEYMHETYVRDHRIQELEKENAELRQAYGERALVIDQLRGNLGHAIPCGTPASTNPMNSNLLAGFIANERDALLARVQKLREAHVSTSRNSCCGQCQQAKLVSIYALTEDDEASK